MKRTKIVDILKSTDFGKEMMVKGWVRTHRSSKAIDSIALNDGSTIKNIQIVVDPSKISADTLKSITTGTYLCVTGTLVKNQGKGQGVEIQCQSIEVYSSRGSDYPMQRKGQSFEYMRQHTHTHLHTDTFGAVMCIRHNMTFVIHQYFHEHGFFYSHTPLITASDAEDVGKTFQVTTQNLNDLKKEENGKVSYEDDFFGKVTSLAVSGQLEGKLGATALGQIHTFGPTFRAENSNTPRHLAGFWMIEPEIAFITLPDSMDLEGDFIKCCARRALDSCKDDPDFFDSMIDKTLLERLQDVLKNSFVRLTYIDGIEILEEAVANGHRFEFPVSWGMGSANEHERFLAEYHSKEPATMYDYPKEIRAFYMEINGDSKTVQGTDVLFLQIEEIIDGSVREESLEELTSEIKHRRIPIRDMQWHLDMHKYDTCPHGGFGLGFERLILFVTSMQNIRDTIPFPRTSKNAEL